MKQTSREAVLAAFDRLESKHHRKDFDLSEIVEEVLSATHDFAESTIRTHVTSKMCEEAPTNHAMKYADLHRTSRGMYSRRL